MRTLVILGLAACSIPTKHLGTSDGSVLDSHDGPGVDTGATGPFRCLGQPLPTTAPAQLTVSGTTDSINSGSQPLGDVQLDVLVAGTTQVTFGSNNQGVFGTQLTTNGMPIDGSLRATASAAGYFVTYQDPSRPYDGDLQLVVDMITPTGLGNAASAGGVAFDTGMAQLEIVVVDCDGMPLSGARIQAATGTVRYVAAGAPSPTATTTDASGKAFVFNANTGNFTVAATTSTNAQLRSHVIDAEAGVWTETFIQP